MPTSFVPNYSATNNYKKSAESLPPSVPLSVNASAPPLPPKRVLPKVAPKGFRTVRGPDGKNVFVPLNGSARPLPPKRVLPPAASTRKRRRSGRKGSRRSSRSNRY